MRAAFYRRVSTSSQVEGFSLQTQLDSLTDLAQRQGYHWEDFCDPGRSGETLEGRPAIPNSKPASPNSSKSKSRLRPADTPSRAPSQLTQTNAGTWRQRC